MEFYDILTIHKIMPAVTSAGTFLLGGSCGNVEQRRTVLLADTSTEFRILLREAMEKQENFW